MYLSQQLVLETPSGLSSKEQQISHDLIHQVSALFFSSFDKCLSCGGGLSFQCLWMNFTPRGEKKTLLGVGVGGCLSDTQRSAFLSFRSLVAKV